MNIFEFEKEKIFERLDYAPEPAGYTGRVPWKVQQQIAATNGIHFQDSVGKLSEYPIPDIPIKAAVDDSSLLLDIGSGWGRWLVAGAKKNYIPIGLDFRLEFCETARQVLKDNGFNGYTVVGDLKELPFREGVFSAVWSFSVIQHTHKDRLLSCINHIYRVLCKGGFSCLEFPNRDGWRNKRGPVKREEPYKDDYNSWCVRYYSIDEYKKMFERIFSNFSFKNHSFLGIGILPNDLKYAKGFKSRLGIAISLGLSSLTKVLTPMKHIADSIYIECFKQAGESSAAVVEFMQYHKADPSNNLNIICLLQCPISGGPLKLSEAKDRLISEKGGVYFPVVNQIPILVPSQAVSLV